MKKNWKTTVASSVSSLGTTLAGVGTLAQFTPVTDQQKSHLFYVALAGFILSAAGKFVSGLFAEDAKHEAQ